MPLDGTFPLGVGVTVIFAGVKPSMVLLSGCLLDSSGGLI